MSSNIYRWIYQYFNHKQVGEYTWNNIVYSIFIGIILTRLVKFALSNATFEPPNDVFTCVIQLIKNDPGMNQGLGLSIR
jgi:hypothetical protein